MPVESQFVGVRLVKWSKDHPPVVQRVESSIDNHLTTSLRHYVRCDWLIELFVF